jgi:hypothetical protein
MRAAGRLTPAMPLSAAMSAALGGLLFLVLVILALALAILGPVYGTGDDGAELTGGGRWMSEDRTWDANGGRWQLNGGRWA